MSSEESTLTATSDNNFSGASDDLELLQASLNRSGNLQHLFCKSEDVELLDMSQKEHKNRFENTGNSSHVINKGDTLNDTTNNQNIGEVKHLNEQNHKSEEHVKEMGPAGDMNSEDTTNLDSSLTEVTTDAAGVKGVNDISATSGPSEESKIDAGSLQPYSPQPSTSSAPDGPFPGTSKDIRYLTEVWLCS